MAEPTPAARELVSQRVCAQRLGVSQTIIGRKVREGVIPTYPGPGKWALIDPEEARRCMDEARDESKIRDPESGVDVPGGKRGRPPAGEPSGFSALRAAQTDEKAARARLAELQLQQRMGLLVDRASAERAWESAAAMRKERLMAIPERMRLDHPPDFCARVREEIEQALRDIADAEEAMARREEEAAR